MSEDDENGLREKLPKCFQILLKLEEESRREKAQNPRLLSPHQRPPTPNTPPKEVIANDRK